MLTGILSGAALHETDNSTEPNLAGTGRRYFRQSNFRNDRIGRAVVGRSRRYSASRRKGKYQHRRFDSATDSGFHCF